MEKMDEQILPAVSRFIGCSFRARPHQLGNITFARALVQALASPFGGIAGGSVVAGRPACCCLPPAACWPAWPSCSCCGAVALLLHALWAPLQGLRASATECVLQLP
jgi:hypothetical protein